MTGDQQGAEPTTPPAPRPSAAPGTAPHQQGELPGMPTRLYSCTPTRLTTWLDCPRRFGFTYLSKLPKGGPWAHNSVGSSVHNALRDWWSLPETERNPRAVGRALRRDWIGLGFRDEAQSHAWREKSGIMVESYVAAHRDLPEPAGVERTVATRTERLALSGRVDRIDRRITDEGEVLVIVDYKTGRWRPDSDDARGSLALAVYAVAAARTLRRPCYRVELHHLPTGTIAAHDHTEQSLARHLARAHDIAEEASAAQSANRPEALEPRPGPTCGWCDFRSHCPEGQAAGPAKQPWDALEPL